jgi:hypothetical protein
MQPDTGHDPRKTLAMEYLSKTVPASAPKGEQTPSAQLPAEDSPPKGETGEQVEIIGPDGKVHYRRPAGHPDIEEAKRTPGYSVRGA